MSDCGLVACRTGRLEAGAWSGMAVGSEAHTFVLFLVNLNWVIFHNGLYSVSAYFNHNNKQRHPFGLEAFSYLLVTLSSCVSSPTLDYSLQQQII